ncbi:MAG: radical SAM protein [Bacteroidales bacterium]|nr:radical SAM protein [Bacteroidales bacterium]
MLRQLPYLGWWYLRALCGRKASLQSVIFILDRCNLRCRHCSVYELSNPRVKTFGQIRDELEYCYKAGSRYVDFEGGELYLWKDGDKTIDDVIDLAHEIGFWSVTITTNAQLPFDGSHADQVWVSMDGIDSFHDEIRGKGAFARLEKNIAGFRCSEPYGRKLPPVCVNMVINCLNESNVAAALDYVKESPDIDSISLNFHTPFKETEELFLDPARRNEIIDMLIERKRQGYPIMNTVPGLKAMKMVDGRTVCTDRWCWVTNFIFSDGSRSPKCMGFTHGVCDRCGFSMGGEMYSLFHLSPATIVAGLKLRRRV